MEWLFIAAVSIGLPLALRPVFAAAWGECDDAASAPADPSDDTTDSPAHARRTRPRWSSQTFAGFALVAGGIGGLVLVGFGASSAMTLVAALALGIAGGSVHPDVVELARRTRRDDNAISV